MIFSTVVDLVYIVGLPKAFTLSSCAPPPPHTHTQRHTSSRSRLHNVQLIIRDDLDEQIPWINAVYKGKTGTRFKRISMTKIPVSLTGCIPTCQVRLDRYNRQGIFEVHVTL